MFAHKYFKKSLSIFNLILAIAVISTVFYGGGLRVEAGTPTPAATGTPKSATNPSGAPNDEIGGGSGMGQMRTTTNAMRIAAAAQQKIKSDKSPQAPKAPATMAPALSVPDYFGVANWAYSPAPTVDPGTGAVTGGMRKFVDGLPVFCPTVNGLGQCIPIASADTTTFPAMVNGTVNVPAADYYEIGLVDYTEQLHSDLPPTRLRGYVQLYPLGTTTVQQPTGVPLTVANGLYQQINDPTLAAGTPRLAYHKPSYLGPIIVATGCDPMSAGNVPATPCVPVPVRVKFTNLLPADTVGFPHAGDLFIPTDGTYMGAGDGPKCVDGTDATPTSTCVRSVYSENRATLHLHGGNSPWISDGTPHQWTAPLGEKLSATTTWYAKGDSVAYVPDMWFDANGKLIPGCQGHTTCATPGATNNPGEGSLTFYWTNQQSGRLMFYHDHAYGVTRLNVYAGEAAGYLLVDNAVEDVLAAAGVPGTMGTTKDLAHLVPLIIQDKTFVPDDGVPGGSLATTDPTWDLAKYGGKGNLWFPHVYTPNQNPADITGANAFGRWDYGPWFWPAQNPATFVPGGAPVIGGTCTTTFYNGTAGPAFPPLVCPGIPNPSGTPESFMDTPLINGTAYPTLTVDPTAYRFQILSAGNDRTLNLSLFVAEPITVAVTNGGAGYPVPPVVVPVTFTGGAGGGTGVAGHAVVSAGGVTGATITDVGKGYTSAPLVTITGNPGASGALATAQYDPITFTVSGINVYASGSGYTTATITIAAPTGPCTPACALVTATAMAVLTPAGTVTDVVIDNPGSLPWISAPIVSIPGGSTLATTITSVNSEVKMVDATSHTAASTLPACTLSNVNNVLGPNLAQAIVDASGNPINGTGMQTNCYPDSWPVDGRAGGVPDPLSAGPAWIQIGTEGGKVPTAVVIPPAPVSYEYNRRSITVLNIFNHSLLLGPAERADAIVDFSKFAGKTILLYNDAPAPVPAFDSRTDFYTGDPDQTSSGGAPTTLPGYGPNTRTIMQIKVNGAVGAGGTVASVTMTNTGGAGYSAPTATIAAPTTGTQATGTAIGKVTALTLTNAGTGYTNPVVTITNDPLDSTGSGATAAASGVVSSLNITNAGSGYLTVPTVTFTGSGTLAAANATGSVNGFTFTPGGTQYTSTAVTLSAPPLGGVPATVTATGAVNAIAVGAGGIYTAVPGVTFTNATGDTTGAGAAATAILGVNTVTVSPAGALYTVPTVVFTGANTTPATAVATGSVDGITVTAGAGYTTPVVTITNATGDTTGTGLSITPTGVVDSLTIPVGGGGSGYTAANPVVTIPPPACTPSVTCVQATATATTVGGIVTGITITDPGAGYSAAPTGITITDTPTPTTSATINATISITGVTINNGGSAYKAAPSITITGGTTNAVATATISVTTVTVTAAGTGYTAAPTIAINDSGTGATLAGATADLKVVAVNVTAVGSNYTLSPIVGFSTGAATATSTLSITSLTVGNAGSGYLTAPVVTFTGGGTGAVATSNLKVSALTLTSPGTGYTSAPTVVFSAPPLGGTLPAATATIASTGITLTNGGSNYTLAPIVTITDTAPGTGSGATAVTTLSITGVTLTNAGTGYTTAPLVTFSDTGIGSGATAIANLTAGASFNVAQLNAALKASWISHEDQIMIPQRVYPAGNGGSATDNYVKIQDNFIRPWYGNPVGGINLVSGGTGYQAPPTVAIVAAAGDPGTGATATLTFSGGVGKITPVNQGNGYSSPPLVTIGAPPVGGVQATATAVLTARKVTSFVITNPGSGYLTAPSVSIAVPTGPLPRIRATATSTLSGSVQTITLTNPGSGYKAAPSIVFTNAVGDTTGTGANAVALSQHMEPKAIQELFTLDYGRMNATLGVEIPFTTFANQTTIPYGYVDPPTEIFKDQETQTWKITHNGVDTHFIHFHLFNVQVINRVGWDGSVKPPEANELGWKDTVRMNPLEDIVVALRVLKQDLPWDLPNSIRPLDVTQPVGSTSTMAFGNVDPLNQPATVVNDLTNFGYEYVWHCHILGHEENDMMRAMILGLAPKVPTGLAAAIQLRTPPSPLSHAVKLTWTDTSLNESGFTVQRSTDGGLSWPVSLNAPAHVGTGPVTFFDTTALRNRTYWYRVIANNVVGYTRVYAAPVSGFPWKSYDSAPTAMVGPIVTNNGGGIGPFAPQLETTFLFASGFESDLAGVTAAGPAAWTASGNVLVQPVSALGPNAASNGMSAVLGSSPSTVSYSMGTAQTEYLANFYFDANESDAGATPVDIFEAKNASGAKIMGIQYQTLFEELESVHQVRGWTMYGGTQTFTPWTEIVDGTHYLEVSWKAGKGAWFSLSVDGNIKGYMSGDTSGQSVKTVVLGPSAGVSATSTGTMFFDDFGSLGVSFNPPLLFMPFVGR